jgi:nicotinamidase-related amidase
MLDEKTALVVIDRQKGILAMPTVHRAADVLAKVVHLVDSFREKGRPVALVRVGWGPDRSDALKSRINRGSRSSRDILVHKRQWGAFYGTDLDLQLRRRSRRRRSRSRVTDHFSAHR